MAETLVYDVNTGWSVKPTIGDIPSRRMYHTMVPSELYAMYHHQLYYQQSAHEGNIHEMQPYNSI